MGGDGLDDLIKRFPNVVAWVNGHEHNNEVRPYPAGPEPKDKGRGFWEIQADCEANGRPEDRNVKLVMRAPFNLGK